MGIHVYVFGRFFVIQAIRSPSSAYLLHDSWCWISSCDCLISTLLLKPFVSCHFDGDRVMHNLFVVKLTAFLVGSIFHVFTFKSEWLGLIILMTWCWTSVSKKNEAFPFVSLIEWFDIMGLLEMWFHWIEYSWRFWNNNNKCPSTLVLHSRN